MSSRRDQAQAYRFLARRQTAALLRADPDSPDAGERRLTTAMFCSVLVAALVLAGFGIAGLIAPGRSKGWRDGRALVVEKGSQTRFIYAGGVLHPVLNYASARLVLGASMKLDSVGSASLRGVPRGLPVGIPGAPDELPAPAALRTGPWTTCSMPATNAVGVVAPYVRLSVGAGTEPTGGRPPVGRALLVVAVPGGARYLIWNDQRFRIRSGFVPAALGYAAGPALPVGAGWLGTVPQGPDLAPARIAGRGRPAAPIAGRPARVGQLFTSLSGGETGPSGQFYVALADGLSPVSPTGAALLLADPATRAAYPGRPVGLVRLSAADLNRAPMSQRGATGSAALPFSPPLLAATGAAPVAVCSTFAGDPGAGLNVAVTARPVPPAELAAVPPGSGAVAPGGGALADQVRVQPGQGAVVQAVGAPGATPGTAYLVTDLGIKYPLPKTDVLGALSLGATTPTPLPGGILALLRTGPALDPAAAALTVAVAGGRNAGAGTPIPVPAGAGG